MGYARYIGRVGALAITLGVGVALGSTAGVAMAEPSGSTSSSSTSSSSTSSGSTSSNSSSSTTAGAAGSAGSDKSSNADADSPAGPSDSGQTSASEPTDTDTDGPDTDASADTDTDADTDPEDADTEAEEPLASATTKRNDTARNALRETDTETETVSDATEDTSGTPDDVTSADDTSDDDAKVSLDESTEAAGQVVTIAAANTRPTASAPARPVPEERPTVAGSVTTAVSGDPAPLVEPDPETPPIQAAIAVAALAAVRDELERNTLQRNVNVTAPQAAVLPVDSSPNVLLIGVDGTNLSRVLADPANANFFELIQDGTTAAASIAGHTTISNPSWSSILTGAWGEKTGVINNIFTPWTYDKWPTVFNQLEGFNPGIQTTSIANWDVISGIAGAGSIPADTIVNISHVAGDSNWFLTDDAVGDATEAAIAAADPNSGNFVFSYFVGVDENGHMHGGASPQYAAAINNFDRNLGEIMLAVNDWEALTGEQWTVIVVTDHGHQPQQGLGHGFQSPDETSTFVIAENPNIFASGAINLRYQIVDVTPTVVTLFGGTPPAYSDGVSLTDLGDSDVFPIDNDSALRGALQDAIGMYGYPDIVTNVALGIRTIATSVPYGVVLVTGELISELRSIGNQNIVLVSALAKAAIGPVQFVGDIAYVATNVVAQIVARLTGVTGASIFPLWPPAAPTFPSNPGQITTPDAAALLCGSGLVERCGAGSIAV